MDSKNLFNTAGRAFNFFRKGGDQTEAKKGKKSRPTKDANAARTKTKDVATAVNAQAKPQALVGSPTRAQAIPSADVHRGIGSRVTKGVQLTERNARNTSAGTTKRSLEERVSLHAARAAEIETQITQTHVPNEVIVRMKNGALEAASVRSSLADCGVIDSTRLDFPSSAIEKANGGSQAPVLLLKLKEGVSVAEAMAMMESEAAVEYCEPNYVLHMIGNAPLEQDDLPDDLTDALWGLHNTGQEGGTEDADIDAPEAWQNTTGSANGPLIAVIDTGIDYNHPDLQGNLWKNPGEIAGDGIDNDENGVIDDVYGYNAQRESGDPMDDHGHGTHCSGTIGGKGDNGQGVVGVNWDAKIMGVKFLGPSGGTTAGAIKSVNYATMMGARVTSNSWGGGGFSQALVDAFESSPAIHIVAAGNDYNDNDVNPTYPASYELDNIVTVAASDRNDKKAGFSNYGATSVDVAAPGVAILSSILEGGYDSWNGTSMATPHVTGIVGLMLDVNPELNNAEIKQALIDTVDRLPNWEGVVVAGGRVNAATAVDTVEIDEVPPGPIASFDVAKAQSSAVSLSFVAPGDDGDQGRARRYIVKVSDKEIVDGPSGSKTVSFDQLETAFTGRPNEAGTEELLSVPVEPQSKERKLYVAIKAADNKGNLSPMAVTRATVPAATVLFHDTGDQAGNWEIEGDWRRIIVEMDPHTKVWTDSPYGSYTGEGSLTTKPVDLRHIEAPIFSYDIRREMAAGDSVDIEVLELDAEGQVVGTTTVASLTGTTGWERGSIRLDDFVGKRIQARFRINANGGKGDGVYIDNVKLSGDPDPVAPRTIDDLQVETTSSTEANVVFTAPGDDGLQGTAKGYTVKVSDFPIVDGEAGPGEVSFDDAPSWEAPAPQSGGSGEAFTIPVGISGQARSVYVAIKAHDDAGNLSAMARVEASIPAAAGVFFEDRVQGSTHSWAADDNWSKVQSAGRGEVWSAEHVGGSELLSDTISLKGLEDLKAQFDFEHTSQFGSFSLNVYPVHEDGSLGYASTVAEFNGAEGWRSAEVDLTKFAGQSIKLGFNLNQTQPMNGSSSVDNIILVGTRDDEAPATVTDLSADMITMDGAELSFTAPGDDGDQGTASQYIVKKSDRPIVDGEAGPGEVSFEDAEIVNVAAPQSAGNEEFFGLSYTPSTEERTMHVALKAVDNVGNASAMASTSFEIPKINAAFIDDMDQGQNGWTPEGTWGQVEVEGRGKVWDDSPGAAYAINENPPLTSAPISLEGFTNLKLRADLKLDIERSYDYLRIEVAELDEAGVPTEWNRLASLDGSKDWHSFEESLDAYEDKQIMLRFRIAADDVDEYEGAMIDTVMVYGEAANGAAVKIPVAPTQN